MKNIEKNNDGKAWAGVMLMFGAALLLSLAAMTFGWVDHQVTIYFLLVLGALMVVACGFLLTSNGGQPPKKKVDGGQPPKKKVESECCIEQL